MRNYFARAWSYLGGGSDDSSPRWRRKPQPLQRENPRSLPGRLAIVPTVPHPRRAAIGHWRQDTMYARIRSGSIDKKTQGTRSRSGSFAEQYNETYTQVEVHHVRNELETLRNSRSKEGNTGCTCRKLDVYLLPPGGGGKKAHSRRMNERKVKEELRKRHLLPQEPKTREELEILLHDTVEKEPCCLEDCACVRHGIECQADACKCWFTSHQAEKGKKHDDTPSIETINSRCGNRFGMYTVDVVKIDDFRSSYICVEIKS
jgi:hypothetical protein